MTEDDLINHWLSQPDLEIAEDMEKSIRNP